MDTFYANTSMNIQQILFKRVLIFGGYYDDKFEGEQEFSILHLAMDSNACDFFSMLPLINI